MEGAGAAEAGRGVLYGELDGGRDFLIGGRVECKGKVGKRGEGGRERNAFLGACSFLAG